MPVGRELHRELQWTPALRFVIYGYINVFVEPSESGPYPRILELKYADVLNFSGTDIHLRSLSGECDLNAGAEGGNEASKGPPPWTSHGGLERSGQSGFFSNAAWFK